ANGALGSCCSANCMFMPSSTQCLAPTGPCSMGANCTGISSACPADANAPDGTPCTGGSCQAGVCVPMDMAQSPNDMTVPPAEDMMSSDAGDMSSSGGADNGTGGGTDLGTGSPTGGCGCAIGGARTVNEAPFAALFALALALFVSQKRNRRP